MGKYLTKQVEQNEPCWKRLLFSFIESRYRIADGRPFFRLNSFTFVWLGLKASERTEERSKVTRRRGRLSGGREREADTKEEMKRRWKGGNPWKTEKRGERQRERVRKEVGRGSTLEVGMLYACEPRALHSRAHFHRPLSNFSPLHCHSRLRHFSPPRQAYSYPFIRNGIRRWCRRAYLFPFVAVFPLLVPWNTTILERSDTLSK